MTLAKWNPFSLLRWHQPRYARPSMNTPRAKWGTSIAGSFTSSPFRSSSAKSTRSLNETRSRGERNSSARRKEINKSEGKGGGYAQQKWKGGRKNCRRKIDQTVPSGFYLYVCQSVLHVELAVAQKEWPRNDKTRHAAPRRNNKSRVRFLRRYHLEIIGSLASIINP